MKLKAPERITFTRSGFCPGCGHGTVTGALVRAISSPLAEELTPRESEVLRLVAAGLTAILRHIDTSPVGFAVFDPIEEMHGFIIFDHFHVGVEHPRQEAVEVGEFMIMRGENGFTGNGGGDVFHHGLR